MSSEGQVLIKLKQVKDMVGISTAQIYQGMKEGWFPKNVKQGSSSFWVLSEIQEYIANLIRARDGEKQAA